MKLEACMKSEDRDSTDHDISDLKVSVTLRRSARKQAQADHDNKDPVRKRPNEPEAEDSADSQANKRQKQSPTKGRKRGYAAPEIYAHLNDLPDHLKDELDVLFCGINPGQRSAQLGHHFAGPTNHFWPCLKQSGFTPQRLPPTEDFTLPEKFSLGLTNLVDRPSAEAELSPAEMAAAIPAFLAKVTCYRPRIVCFVGMGIWRIVEKALLKLARYPDNVTPQKKAQVVTIGIQPYKLVFPVSQSSAGGPSVQETLFFVMPSTSGRVVSHQLSDKVKIFSALKQNVDDVKLSRIDTTRMAIISSAKADI